jgi:hypothetical protein
MEHSDAQEQVKNLRVKARRIGRSFHEFGAIMEGQPERLIDASGQFTGNSQGALDLICYHRVQLDQLQVGSAFSVCDELRKALRTLNDVEQQMRGVGLKID